MYHRPGSWDSWSLDWPTKVEAPVELDIDLAAVGPGHLDLVVVVAGGAATLSSN
jgi:hypothetical protein